MKLKVRNEKKNIKKLVESLENPANSACKKLILKEFPVNGADFAILKLFRVFRTLKNLP
jgi:hypothetical protein